MSSQDEQASKKLKTNDGTSVTTSTLTETSDVDDLLGDLVKEELQLVLTRFLRDSPTSSDGIKKQCVKIINSRTKQSTPAPSQQLKVMQQLLQQHSQLALGITQAVASGDVDATQPLALFSQAMGLGGDLLPRAGGASGDFSSLFGDQTAAIRRKIRDAFKKDKFASIKRGRQGEEIKHSFRVDTTVIRTELEKAKDLILNKNESRTGLTHLEAITAEFTERGTEIGVSNVTGFNEVLTLIAADWEEVFLFENLDIDQAEREEFAQKLFECDISPNEEEGIFSTARQAAKLGWNNIHLKNVLKGDSLGKFKEPQKLSIARLNNLERQKRFEEAVNLAKAVDLDFYAAKFLLKLNRFEEALKSAAIIDDSEKLFSLAQIARSSDPYVSFQLAILAILNNKEWNKSNQEIAPWALDLAISSKMLDKVLEAMTTKITNKNLQFEIVKLLKEKEQYATALQICKLILKPVFADPNPVNEANYASVLGMAKLPTTLGSPQQTTGASAISSTPTDASSSTPQANPFDIEEGSLVPKQAVTYTWLLIYEMVLLELVKEEEMHSLVDFVVENVQDIPTLIQLLNELNNKQEFEQVLVLGSKIFDKIKEQQKREVELQKLLLKNAVDIEIRNLDEQRNIQFNQQPNQPTPPFVPIMSGTVQYRANMNPILDGAAFDILVPHLKKHTTLTMIQQVFVYHNITYTGSVATDNVSQNTVNLLSITHNGNYNNQKMSVARSMILAALESRNPLLQIPNSNNIATGLKQTLQKRIPKQMPRGKVDQCVEYCLEQLTLIDSFNNLQTELKNRFEYALSIRVADSAHKTIDQVIAEVTKYGFLQKEYVELQKEDADLAAIKKLMKADRKQRLDELKYVLRCNALLESQFSTSLPQLEQYHNTVSFNAILTLMDSKASQSALEESLVPKESVETIFNSHLDYMKQPQQFLQLAQQCRNKEEYDMALVCARRVKRIVDDFEVQREVRERIAVPLAIILQEQNEMVEKRQQLAPPRQQELQKLQQDLAKLPERISYDPYSADAYENLRYQCASMMLSSSFQSKRPMTSVSTTKTFSEEKIQQIKEEALTYVKNPDLVINLAQECNRYTEVQNAISLCERAQDMNRSVIEERKQREKPKIEYEFMINEVAELEEAKKLKPETLKQFKDAELQQKLEQVLLPSFNFKNIQQLEQIYKSSVDIVLETLLQVRRDADSKLQQFIQQELVAQNAGAVSAADQMQDEGAVDLKQQYKQIIADSDKQIEASVHRALQFVNNPWEMLKLAKYLNSNQQYALGLVVSTAVQTRIEQVEKERQAKQVWLDELATLEEEERDLEEQRKQTAKRKKLDADKEKRLKELRMDQRYLSIFPSYLNSTKETLENLHLDNAKAMISACVDRKATDDRRMELEHVAEEERERVRKEHDNRIVQVIDQCLVYVQNPEHINSLVDRGNDISLAFKLGTKALENVRWCIQKRREYDIPDQTIQIYEQEEKDLQLLRKTLSEEQKLIVKQCEQKMADLNLPSYVLNKRIDHFNTWKHQALLKMLKAALSKKSEFENRMSYDQTLTAEMIHQEMDSLEKNIAIVVDLICDLNIGTESPNDLSTFVVELFNSQEYSHAIRVGTRAFEILHFLRLEEEKRQIPQQNFVLLQQEEQNLLQQRKQLTPEKIEELRDLKLKHKLHALQPSYYHLNQDQYDKLSSSIARNMIKAALEAKSSVESMMEVEDSQNTNNNQSEELKAASLQIEKVSDICIQNVHSVENLVQICKELSAKLEYGLVLRVGKQCQNRIYELKKQVDQIKKLEEERNELQQKFKISRDSKAQVRLQDIEIELSKLPVKYQGTKLLDKMLFTTAKLMMSAAKIEQDNQVLLEQAITVFKLHPSSENFGEVKVLCDEKQWEGKLKLELLNYVLDLVKQRFANKNEGQANEEEEDDFDEDEDDDMDLDEDDYKPKKKKPAKKTKKSKAADKPKSNPLKDMIELLLNEGYWKQCVDVFPPAPGASIEMLERLWIEVDKSNNKQLKVLVPLMHSYISHEMLVFQFDNCTTLLDLLENYSIDETITVFTDVADKLVINLTQKQYETFVEYLKLVKKRLTSKNKTDEWSEFFEDIKKKNKTKKKLMNLIEVEHLE